MHGSLGCHLDSSGHMQFVIQELAVVLVQSTATEPRQVWMVDEMADVSAFKLSLQAIPPSPQQEFRRSCPRMPSQSESYVLEACALHEDS